jgi:hypothetical protein
MGPYRRLGRTYFFLPLVAGLFLSSATVRALQASDLDKKIAFLRDREVWIVDRDGRNARQVTQTNGSLKEPDPYFLFSLSFRYRAHCKFLKYSAEFDEETNKQVPGRAVTSIVITDLTTQKTVKEILPPEGNYVYPDHWLPNDRLLFHESSGFDVSGFFEYDVKRNGQRELDSEKGSQLYGADVHPDGSLMAYVTDSGLGPQYQQHLHLVDSRSHADRILVSRRSILSPSISNQKKYVAFIEVEDVKGEYFHNLWIADIKDGSLKHLYRRKGIFPFAWSFDDGLIGMFLPPEAIVLAIRDPARTETPQGRECVWIDTDRILYVEGDSIHLYNVSTHSTNSF